MPETAVATVTAGQGKTASRPEGAVVLGGALGSLGIARSLGRQGIPVCLLANDHRPAKYSRYVRHAPDWPVLATPSLEAEYLMWLAGRHGFEQWALFPGGDLEAEMIARNHAQLARRFRLTTPPWDVLRWAYDKRLIYWRAASLGIAQPRSWNPRSLKEAAEIPGPFPMVLKPAVKSSVSALRKAKVWRVDSRAELLARYAEADAEMDGGEVLVQEYILASGKAQCSYAGLWANGRALVSMTAQCLRQYPTEFGCASYVRTIEEPEVEEIAGRYLAAIGYTGLVEVEFKRDPRDGRYKLLDVNPRTWAWHSLGRRAGIDFPFLQWCELSGRGVDYQRARPGVAWVHMARDLAGSLQEMLRGRLTPAEYFRSLAGPLEFAAFATDDPIPGWMDFPLLVGRALARIAR